MTREDIERMFAYQAADAAYKYAGDRCRKDRPISASKLEAFEAGAEWAKEFMIERACDWLKLNLGSPKDVHPVLVNHLIYNFRKAMEE